MVVEGEEVGVGGWDYVVVGWVGWLVDSFFFVSEMGRIGAVGMGWVARRAREG